MALPSELSQITASNLSSLVEEVKSGWEPPEKYSTKDWLEKHLKIPAADADFSGPFNADYVPYFWGVMHALDSISVFMVVLMKAAQIGWTLLETGWIGKIIDTQPCRILALFPKDDKARDFMEEKFEPTVKASPTLLKKIDVSTSRKSGNRSTKKNFPGGFLKAFGSNSVSNVKSTPAQVVIVEEPDDTNANVGDQGDAIRLARERVKRFRNSKFVLGGTPSVEDVSEVQHYTKLGSQRVLPVTCHDCGAAHVLDWENVKWQEKEGGTEHPIFKLHLPETARYCCPDCGSVWDDWQRQQNVFNTCLAAKNAGDPFCGWVATVETDGNCETFKDLSELYVCIPGTSLASVVRDYLEAEHEAALGDETARIVFRNSKLGKPYEFTSEDSIDHEALKALADNYSELVCPVGGLVVCAGVDVQHDRLAIVIRVWGRNEESWLLLWQEIPGNTIDKNDPVWAELDKILFNGFEHETLGRLFLTGVTIDSSDGTTSHAVYEWVRTRGKKHRTVSILAGKGDSNDNGKREIFRLPSKIDHNNPRKPTKADKHGVLVYLIGTHKAKDLIAKRLRGTSAFMHSYDSAREDYWEQVTAEIKAPKKGMRGVLVWQCRPGRRNEATDCEVYALHAALAVKVHTKSDKAWSALEQRLSQRDLFSEEKTEEPAEPPSEAQRPKQNSRRRKGTGFVSKFRG